jgi:hypothetical protein
MICSGLPPASARASLRHWARLTASVRQTSRDIIQETLL